MNPARTDSLAHQPAPSPTDRSARRRPALGWLVASLAALTLAGGAQAMPERGSAAPDFTLATLDGERVSLSRFQGRAIVLFFGELGHERTNEAAADIAGAIDDRRMGEEEAVVIMVVAHDRAREEIPAEARGANLPELILHDPQREAFGAYRILVIPSVVVVGTDGRIVYAAPGFVPRFRQLLGEALLVATGLETAEEFDRAVNQPGTDDRDPVETRVDRLLSLGEQLERRGMAEMAEARYREAIALAPQLVRSRLALGRLLLDADRLDEAEAEFRAALAGAPESIDASLGVAETLLRGRPERAGEAEQLLRAALETDPDSARAHYLIGTLHQRRDEHREAALAFRRAAELLLKK